MWLHDFTELKSGKQWNRLFLHCHDFFEKNTNNQRFKPIVNTLKDV